MNWYIKALKNYAVFSGRAGRKEYWYFLLFHFIILIVLAFIDVQIGWFDAQRSIGVLAFLYSLAVLLPALGVTIRRLHDTNRSGWWIFISLIPLIGGIILLVFMALAGTPGSNQYGANPADV